ncbi:MAG: adenine phosphoribosyltransferase [Spirochaetales bacterium]|nr:adenine phosphoribosyltransferase [Spirochaetales bacterium]
MSATSFLDNAIRKVPDFPKPGILFYDITSILTNPEAFRFCIEEMKKRYGHTAVDRVAAVEARGFLFAAPFAKELGKPLVLLRKKGKLPGETISKRFTLEYGEDEIHVQKADVVPGENVLIVDDLIATGGTLKASAEIIEQAGAKVCGIFGVIGLPFLRFSEVLQGYTVSTLIDYNSES